MFEENYCPSTPPHPPPPNAYPHVPISISTLQAAHRNLTSLRYVWISHGWYSNQWWTQAVANEAVNCSDAKLEVFLANSRTLAVNHLPAPTNPNAETAAGIVSCAWYHTVYATVKWLKPFCSTTSNRSDLHTFKYGKLCTRYIATNNCRRVWRIEYLVWLVLPWLASNQLTDWELPEILHLLPGTWVDH